MEFLRPMIKIELICQRPAMTRPTGIIGVISPAVGCWIGWLGADAVIWIWMHISTTPMRAFGVSASTRVPLLYYTPPCTCPHHTWCNWRVQSHFGRGLTCIWGGNLGVANCTDNHSNTWMTIMMQLEHQNVQLQNASALHQHHYRNITPISLQGWF